MKIFLKGRNLRLTQALRDYVDEKIGRLDHYFDHIIDAHVTLRTERAQQIVDVLLNLKHYVIKAEERSTDMYASIDLVRDRLEQQIRKYKTRRYDHHIRAAAPATRAPRAGTEKRRQPAPPDAEAEKELRIVRSKRIALKPISQQEAMRQMELLHHDFFVFINDETGAINVLYKRRSGDLGLMEPVS